MPIVRGQIVQQLLRCAIVAALASPAGATVYQADFNGASGYALGPIGGQQGWTGDPAAPGDSSVATSPYFVSRTLALVADGGFDGFFHLGAKTPVFATPSTTTVTADQQLVIDNIGGSDFLVETVDTTAGIPAVQVQFTSFGNVIVNGANTPVFWTKGIVFNLTLVHDLTLHQASVLINGAPIATGVAIPGVGGITQVQYGLDDFILSTPVTMFVDNLAVTPEPAAAVLWVAIATVAFRKRLAK